jgi:uncharacterized membrane protein YjgN (DUF898 family)
VSNCKQLSSVKIYLFLSIIIFLAFTGVLLYLVLSRFERMSSVPPILQQMASEVMGFVFLFTLVVFLILILLALVEVAVDVCTAR